MADSSENYVVAGNRPWCREVFDGRIRHLPGHWTFLSAKEELAPELLTSLGPAYIFFLHWSWMVPEAITASYECVNFHIGDLPFGRGGSPLQNHVARGTMHSRLAAIRMTRSLDAGPIYAQADLCLAGNAEWAYLRANELAAALIAYILAERPVPVDQQGDPVVFARRSPSDSEIGDLASIEQLATFIDMLDAEGYPRAFIDHAGFRYQFSRPARYTGRVVADVTITRFPEEDDL